MLTDMDGEQFLRRLPSDAGVRSDVVLFLPWWMGTLETAGTRYERWIQGGDGEDDVISGEDAAWSDPVRADFSSLTDLGVEVVFVEWPGEGHVVSDAFDTTQFFNFWAGR